MDDAKRDEALEALNDIKAHLSAVWDRLPHASHIRDQLVAIKRLLAEPEPPEKTLTTVTMRPVADQYQTVNAFARQSGGAQAICRIASPPRRRRLRHIPRLPRRTAGRGPHRHRRAPRCVLPPPPLAERRSDWIARHKPRPRRERGGVCIRFEQPARQHSVRDHPLQRQAPAYPEGAEGVGRGEPPTGTRGVDHARRWGS